MGAAEVDSGAAAGGRPTRSARWRVVAAWGLLLGGAVAWAGMWISAMRSSPRALEGTEVGSVVVPGSDVVTLATGRYTLYRKGPEECVPGSAGCEPPVVVVRPTNGEPALDVTLTGSTHDTLFGVGIATVDVDHAGDYAIDGGGDIAVLTVTRGPLFDPGPGRSFILLLAGGPGVFIAGIFAAVAVAPRHPDASVHPPAR